MDCNSYSYMNGGGAADPISSFTGAGAYLFIEDNVSFFGDRFFTVSDVLNGIAEEFPYTRASRDAALAAALDYYNGLVATWPAWSRS